MGQTIHQTDWLAGTAVVLTIQSLESRFDFSSIDFVGQLTKRVRLVRHVGKVAEQARGVIWLFNHKICKFPDPMIRKFADSSKTIINQFLEYQ